MRGGVPRPARGRARRRARAGLSKLAPIPLMKLASEAAWPLPRLERRHGRRGPGRTGPPRRSAAADRRKARGRRAACRGADQHRLARRGSPRSNCTQPVVGVPKRGDLVRIVRQRHLPDGAASDHRSGLGNETRLGDAAERRADLDVPVALELGHELAQHRDPLFDQVGALYVAPCAYLRGHVDPPVRHRRRLSQDGLRGCVLKPVCVPLERCMCRYCRTIAPIRATSRPDASQLLAQADDDVGCGPGQTIPSSTETTSPMSSAYAGARARRRRRARLRGRVVVALHLMSGATQGFSTGDSPSGSEPPPSGLDPSDAVLQAVRCIDDGRR